MKYGDFIFSHCQVAENISLKQFSLNIKTIVSYGNLIWIEVSNDSWKGMNVLNGISVLMSQVYYQFLHESVWVDLAR